MKLLVLVKDLHLREKIIACTKMVDKVGEVIGVGCIEELRRESFNYGLLISDLSLGKEEMLWIERMKQRSPQLRLILYIPLARLNEKMEVAIRGWELSEKIVFQELGVDRLANVLEWEVIQGSDTRMFGDVLPVKSQSEIILIKYTDLIFVEKINRKLIYHLTHRKIETYGTLKELEDQLPFYFYRSHRSYIINLQKVKMIIPQGRSYLVAFPYIEDKAILSYDRQKELADQFLL